MEGVFDPNTGTADPAVADGPETTEGMLRQLLAQQQEHRAEVAALREQLNAQKQPAPPAAAPSSAEELLKSRMEAIHEHDFYCPGCGSLYNYQRECTGRPEAPHAPIDVISTDELRGEDKSQHTAAPNTDTVGVLS